MSDPGTHETATSVLFWDVDTQRDFMRPDGALYVPEAEEIIPNLARLTRAVRDLSIPVVASADAHRTTDPEISVEPDFVETFPHHCMAGTAGARRIPETELAWTLEVGLTAMDPDELASAIERRPARVLILKNSVDAFENPNTEAIVASLAPERIVVYGVALDICNRRTVEGLLARGHRGVEVVVDATRPIDPGLATRLLEEWAERGVTLSTTDEVLGGLRRGL